MPKLAQLVFAQPGAKRPLTKKQKALVEVLVASALAGSNKRITLKEAGKQAGYGQGESGRVAASQTIRKPQVQAYLMQRISETLGTSAVDALHTLTRLVRSAKSEYVQLEAARDVLDRTGFKPPERKDVRIAGDVSVHIDLSDPR